MIKIDKLTKKQRYLAFFGLILPLGMGIIMYSIYMVYTFEPVYKVVCAGEVFETHNKTLAEEHFNFCEKYIIPKYKEMYQIKLNINNISHLLNDSNITR